MKNPTNKTERPLLKDRPLLSLRELVYLLGVEREKLVDLMDWKKHYCPFQKAKNLKPHSRVIVPLKYRTIDNPSKELKRVQSKILRRLLSQFDLPDFLYGAVAKKSTRDHALAHLGAKTVVSIDIKGYFENVSSKHVYLVWRDVLGCSPEVSRVLTKLTTCAYHLPQGAPTSPALANLFLSSIFGPVLDFCRTENIIITTWLDDIVFSGLNARQAMEVTRQTLAHNGLTASRRKRKIGGSKATKIVTGVRLGAKQPRASRSKMGDIRAGIENLSRGKVTSRGREADIKSLTGRIAQVESICKADAARLKRLLGEAGLGTEVACDRQRAV